MKSSRLSLLNRNKEIRYRSINLGFCRETQFVVFSNVRWWRQKVTLFYSIFQMSAHSGRSATSSPSTATPFRTQIKHTAGLTLEQAMQEEWIQLIYNVTLMYLKWQTNATHKLYWDISASKWSFSPTFQSFLLIRHATQQWQTFSGEENCRSFFRQKFWLRNFCSPNGESCFLFQNAQSCHFLSRCFKRFRMIGRPGSRLISMILTVRCDNAFWYTSNCSGSTHFWGNSPNRCISWSGPAVAHPINTKYDTYTLFTNHNIHLQFMVSVLFGNILLRICFWTFLTIWRSSL